MKLSGLDEKVFRRVLLRNIVLPTVVMAAMAGIFIGLIFYLLSLSRWVEHSEQIIARSHAPGGRRLQKHSRFRTGQIHDG